ncbi:MAG: DNA polymerase III subunit gamma/tau [Cyanobacteria bacterium J06638_28]
MGYEPLHHKYRPQTFTQLVGQDAIATTLSHALEQRRIAPAYLFCGPRGTGKTSSARILAKSLNCLNSPTPTASPCGQCDVCLGINKGSILDIVEIDAASNTGVDNIRELIERAQFAPVQCRFKVYVIDECHMLSTAAFNALLKTLEEPPEHVIFVLATTDPQRVLPTIISRCQRFDFRRIPIDAMTGHLQAIATQEGIQITEDAVRLVSQIAQGGLRDAQSLLDQLSLLEPPVTAEKVWELVGAVPERELLELVQAIATDDSVAMLETARRLMDRGREPMIVLQNLAGFYRDLLIAQAAGARSDLVAVTPSTWDAMQTFVQTIDRSLLLGGQETLRQAEIQLRNTTQPRLWLEVTLTGLLPSALAVPSRSLGSTVAKPTAPVVYSQSPAIRPSVPTPAPAQAAEQNQAASSPSVAEAQPKVTTPTSASASPPDVPTTPVPTSPEPTPSSPVPAEPSVPVAHADVIELGQIWNQVIAHLQPMGTRALMQQQGHLMAYSGTAARIGIKSKPLFKMAQGRVDNVEAAFQQVFGQTVKVSLEVADPPQDDEPPPTTTPLPTPPDRGPSPATVAHPSPVSPPPRQPSASSPPSPVQPTVPSNQASIPASWAPTSDLDRAVKSFADFFNGQIVSLDDEEADVSSQQSDKSENAQTKPSAKPDSDVPF